MIRPIYFICLAISFLALSPPDLLAQFPSTDEIKNGEAKTAGDYAQDVASVDNIIHALYEVISGPKGSKVNLDRWNNLFTEGAILAPTGKRPTGEYAIQVISPKDYMANVFGNGVMPWNFYEIETDRSTDSFGSVTQVFSTYESRQNPDDVKAFDRGINSIQLYHDGNRYWVLSIFWDRERADLPVPGRYDG